MKYTLFNEPPFADSSIDCDLREPPSFSICRFFLKKKPWAIGSCGSRTYF